MGLSSCYYSLHKTWGISLKTVDGQTAFCNGN